MEYLEQYFGVLTFPLVEMWSFLILFGLYLSIYKMTDYIKYKYKCFKYR